MACTSHMPSVGSGYTSHSMPILTAMLGQQRIHETLSAALGEQARQTLLSGHLAQVACNTECYTPLVSDRHLRSPTRTALPQVLDLSNNAFTEWPLPQCQLPSLREVSLSNNGRLLSAPQDALRCCAGSLQSLDVSGMHQPHTLSRCAVSLGRSWDPDHPPCCGQAILPKPVGDMWSTPMPSTCEAWKAETHFRVTAVPCPTLK